MTYAVSDLHGCCKSWLALLDKIHFSDEDLLYIVGDVVDRGPRPVSLLLDLSGRANVIPIAGNHDFMAVRCLHFLAEEVTEESVADLEQTDRISELLDWLNDGGRETMEDFQRADADSREIVLDYLEEFSLYEETTVNGISYLLAHAGVENYTPGRPLSDYPPDAFAFSRTDYSRCLDPGRYLITGHTPTRSIPGAEPDAVYQANHHIAIDCGCVYGGRLAAFCLETGEAFYVPNLDC